MFKFTDVRLVNGNHPWEGRVEVRRNGAWGTICESYWDAREAGVLCRSLGYAGAIAIGRGDFGQGSGTVYNYQSCNGNEDSILDCGPGSVSICSHVYDAGVICRTQSKQNYCKRKHYNHSVCPSFFYINDAWKSIKGIKVWHLYHSNDISLLHSEMLLT